MRLSQPTLVGWTDDDRHIDPAVVAELAAVVLDAPRLRRPTGGHDPQKSQAIEIGRALRRWVRGLSSAKIDIKTAN